MTARNEPAGVYDRLAQALVAAVMLGFLVGKFTLLDDISVNWDEFMFLSRVHEFARGDLTTPFQTFHVHLFGWLTRIDGTAVDQVVAGRLLAFGLRVASGVCVYLIARRVASPSASLVAVLGTLTFSYLARHGAAFRADSLIVFLFLLAATLLILKPERLVAGIVGGVAFALAANISVKTVLYAPTIAFLLAAAVLGADGELRRRRLMVGLAFIGTGIVSYTAFYVLHSAATSAAGTQLIGNAVASGGGMMGNPPTGVLLRSLRADGFFWALCAGGALIALAEAVGRSRSTVDRSGRAPALAVVLALLFPLTALGWYRNSWQYFYVCVVPLAVPAIALALAKVEGIVAARARPMVAVIATAILAITGWRSLRTIDRGETAPQRAVLAGVQEIFPEPVAYLDRCGMVATFPQANMFMSSYVTAAYRRRGEPQMPQRMARLQPKFLLANVTSLSLGSSWIDASRSPHRLLRQDFEFLQANFVHHWGPVWVVGKRVTLAANPRHIEILVAGPYTVEASAPVMIDSVRRASGEVVHLAAGTHAVSGAGELVLRWGSRLARPAAAAPQDPLFRAL